MAAWAAIPTRCISLPGLTLKRTGCSQLYSFPSQVVSGFWGSDSWDWPHRVASADLTYAFYDRGRFASARHFLIVVSTMPRSRWLTQTRARRPPFRLQTISLRDAGFLPRRARQLGIGVLCFAIDILLDFVERQPKRSTRRRRARGRLVRALPEGLDG